MGKKLVFSIGGRSCLREMVAHGGSIVDPHVSDRPKYEGLAVVELTEGILRGEVRTYLHFEEMDGMYFLGYNMGKCGLQYRQRGFN